MIAIPTASTQEAASKGDTGPRESVSARKLANNPDKMAMSPLPKNTAFEKVIDNHWASNPLCQNSETKVTKIATSRGKISF